MERVPCDCISWEVLVQLHCWCSGIMQDSHSCDPGSIPGQCTFFFLISLTAYNLLFSSPPALSPSLPSLLFPSLPSSFPPSPPLSSLCPSFPLSPSLSPLSLLPSNTSISSSLPPSFPSLPPSPLLSLPSSPLSPSFPLTLPSPPLSLPPLPPSHLSAHATFPASTGSADWIWTRAAML